MDRRTLLTAALVAPVVIAAPAVAQTLTCSYDPGASPFPAALAEYQRLRTECDNLSDGTTDDVARAIDKAADRALARMLETPARDIADIATKLDIYIFEYADCEMDEERLAIIARDARRLASH